MPQRVSIRLRETLVLRSRRRRTIAPPCKPRRGLGCRMFTTRSMRLHTLTLQRGAALGGARAGERSDIWLMNPVRRHFRFAQNHLHTLQVKLPYRSAHTTVVGALIVVEGLLGSCYWTTGENSAYPSRVFHSVLCFPLSTVLESAISSAPPLTGTPAEERCSFNGLVSIHFDLNWESKFIVRAGDPWAELTPYGGHAPRAHADLSIEYRICMRSRSNQMQSFRYSRGNPI